MLKSNCNVLTDSKERRVIETINTLDASERCSAVCQSHLSSLFHRANCIGTPNVRLTILARWLADASSPFMANRFAELNTSSEFSPYSDLQHPYDTSERGEQIIELYHTARSGSIWLRL